jgi:hypothetical protein
MWEGVRDWPAKYGTDLKEDFDGAFERSIEEVYDEVVYFLAFATDYAFWSQLENKPQIRSAVSGAFLAHVRQFAQEHHCSPIPAGDWLGDGLIWIPSGTTDTGSSLANLRSRFDLYGQSLSRRHDRSAGERAAHLLAACCGTVDSEFILYATPLFLGKWKSVKEMVGSFNIKPGFGDKIQDLAGSAIVSGFRNLALHNACAPTAKTSDEKILEIYSKVTGAFNVAAEERGERIPAVFFEPNSDEVFATV